MANEGAVFSLSDLWVAAATQKEEEDAEDTDAEAEAEADSVFEDDESRIEFADDDVEPDFFGFGTAPPSLDDIRATAAAQSVDRLRGYGSPSLTVPTPRSRLASGTSYGRSNAYRRPSIINYGSYRGPGIFANTGLHQASLASAPILSPKAAEIDSPFNTMDAIPERLSGVSTDATATQQDLLEEQQIEEDPNPASLIRQLPLALIAQYALLALHCTATDQVFM